MTSVVAVSVNPQLHSVSILTALGDIVIVDSHCKKKPKRLKKESEVQPFISQHTRDCIFSWARNGTYVHCMRVIKPGGVVQQINV